MVSTLDSPPIATEPPSVLTILYWVPSDSDLVQGLFPHDHRITITPSSETAGDYLLTWRNVAGNDRAMTLSWNDGSLTGMDVTIYNTDDNQHVPWIDVQSVTISLVDGKWQGDLGPALTGVVGNTGTFVAQATTGGSGYEPEG